jgi:hypothetical protein
MSKYTWQVGRPMFFPASNREGTWRLWAYVASFLIPLPFHHSWFSVVFGALWALLVFLSFPLKRKLQQPGPEQLGCGS